MLRNTYTHAVNANNVGIYDQYTRLLLAAVLLSPVFLTSSGPLDWMTLPILASVYPILTAIMAWDPIYARLNFSTVRDESVPGNAEQELEAPLSHARGNASPSATLRVAAQITQAEASNNSSQTKRVA